MSFHEPVMETCYTSSSDPVEYETTRSDERGGQRRKTRVKPPIVMIRKVKDLVTYHHSLMDHLKTL